MAAATEAQRRRRGGRCQQQLRLDGRQQQPSPVSRPRPVAGAAGLHIRLSPILHRHDHEQDENLRLQFWTRRGSRIRSLQWKVSSTQPDGNHGGSHPSPVPASASDADATAPWCHAVNVHMRHGCVTVPSMLLGQAREEDQGTDSVLCTQASKTCNKET
jgi:hypothetical protein